MWQRFTDRARKVILLGQEEARRMTTGSVGTEHLLLGLVRENEGVAAQVLERMGVSLGKVRGEVEGESTVRGESRGGSEPNLSPRAKRVLELAADEARRMKHNYIVTEHLLLALLREKDGVAAKVLRKLGLNLEKVRQQVMEYLGPEAQVGGQQQQKQRSTTPALDAFGRDITALAVEGALDPVVGRDSEVERVIQILCRRTKNNPVLVGEAGVGKTAIVEGLASRIVAKDVPEPLLEKRLIALDLALVVAGTKYRGEFEERMKRLMQEIRQAQGKIIIFIDELHTMIGAGAAEGAIDASNMLKPALARGELRCIGATTLDEYRKYIERQSALERRFQMVLVAEPTVEDTIEILKGIRPKYEEFHKVRITDLALTEAAELSQRYITARCLPDKAIDVMDEASSRVKLQVALPPRELRDLSRELDRLRADKEHAVNSSEYERAADLRDRCSKLEEQLNRLQENWQTERGEEAPTVTDNDIAHIVSEWTGVPLLKLTEAESARLLRMEEELHGKVIGQDEAISVLAKAIRRGRAGLKNSKKPTGCFLFVGPTGVGKTHLAKALADFLFGSDDALIKVDMSDYMERFNVSRLVGSPPGYVGYDEGGQLTEQVRRRPYSVVLLDEIEKAHPEVFNLLLQVMDEGRLTDAQGRLIDFRNTVLIMTSNVGSSDRDKSMGFRARGEDGTIVEADKEMKSRVLEAYKQQFRPEFRNRVDEVVVFHHLSDAHVGEIVTLELQRLLADLHSREIVIEFADSAKQLLVKEGYDRAFGARPLQRTIRRLLEDPLSEKILASEFRAGDTILVEADGAEMVFRLRSDEFDSADLVEAELTPA